MIACEHIHRDPALDYADLKAAKAYARGNVVSMWHLVGTCAMLPKDKAGVVDSQLNVYGVENLQAVDASAFPLVSTANLQATVYVFAEKAADLLEERWSMKEIRCKGQLLRLWFFCVLLSSIMNTNVC